MTVNWLVETREEASRGILRGALAKAFSLNNTYANGKK
jgi:hypothetical protein